MGRGEATGAGQEQERETRSHGRELLPCGHLWLAPAGSSASPAVARDQVIAGFLLDVAEYGQVLCSATVTFFDVDF